MDAKELVTALVTTLKILARMSNTLVGMRRDTVSTQSKQFLVGGVSERSQHWGTISNNPWVNQMVKGVKVEITSLPKQTVLPVSIEHLITK